MIPTYDRPDDLRKTLATVAAQDATPDGVIVIDDGSEDLAAVKAAFADVMKDRPFECRLLRRGGNSGRPNVPRIEAMKLVPKDAMVVEVDDHDLVAPGAFKAMREAMEAGAAMVFGDCVRFGQTTEMTPDWVPDWFTTEDAHPTGKGLAWRCWRKQPYTPFMFREDHCEVCGVRAYRRDLYDYVGGWRAHEFPAGDGALFLRFEAALGGTRIVKLDRTLTWVRVTATGLSYRMSKEQGQAYLKYQMLAKLGRFLNEVAPEDLAEGALWTKRFGIWLATSKQYSGGRIHMYQAAVTLAELGAEVFLITNGMPAWANDYPDIPGITVLVEGTDHVPADIDVAITDSKVGFGKRARDWAKANDRPVACLNFETPNWVAEFIPEIAVALGTQEKECFAGADVLMANSRESGRYLQKWLETDQTVYTLPPKVNTFALEMSRGTRVSKPSRPYAVWSARSASYKGGDVALKAVWALDVPFDVVCFGFPKVNLGDTPLHRLHRYPNRPDAEKFALMRGAHLVLAPSKFEGFGMVPSEALASGTPCVVYDLPVLREEYGDVLEYVEWGNEDAFCDKVNELARKPKLKVDRRAAVRKFGLDSMVDEVEAIPCLSVRRPHVSAHMLAYWGFVPQSLESVYPHVDEIRIAFGRVAQAPEVDDGSLERVRAFPDPDNKITLEVREQWPNKRVMREWGTARCKGNYQLLLDGDEVWVGLDRWVAAGFRTGSPRWVNFWHGPKHWVHDSRGQPTHWGHRLPGLGGTCPHYRWSYWRNSFRWLRHCVPGGHGGQPLFSFDIGPAEAVPECCIYHLGHALPAKVMEAKYGLYASRDRADPARREAFDGWNGKPGMTADGEISEVDWRLPAIVKRAFKAVEG